MDRTTNRNRRPCPYCGRPSTSDSFPFCSDRCRLLDLSGWLNEVYTIPAQEPPDDDDPQTIH